MLTRPVSTLAVISAAILSVTAADVVTIGLAPSDVTGVGQIVGASGSVTSYAIQDFPATIVVGPSGYYQTYVYPNGRGYVSQGCELHGPSSLACLFYISDKGGSTRVSSDTLTNWGNLVITITATAAGVRPATTAETVVESSDSPASTTADPTGTAASTTSSGASHQLVGDKISGRIKPEITIQNNINTESKTTTEIPTESQDNKPGASTGPPKHEQDTPAPAQYSQRSMSNGTFCPLIAVSRYPYKFIRGELTQKVASQFFDAGKFWDRCWDIYYIHPPPRVSSRHLLLVPEPQVRIFLQEINNILECNLSIPSDSEKGMFLQFTKNANFPQPIFLGQSICHQDKDQLDTQVPRVVSRMAPTSTMDEDYIAFEQMMEPACSAAKPKNKSSKAKQQSRLQNQIRVVEGLAHVQRYLGLRNPDPCEQPPKHEDLTWGGQNYQETISANHPPPHPQTFDLKRPAPHAFWKDAVFISVDIESNERCHTQVTEVGISMLDTRDLVGVPPGQEGGQWRARVKSRHLRVREYNHIVNHIYVAGCPERFEFGESEWVSETGLGGTVLGYFRPAESAGEGGLGRGARNLVLVGHSTATDIEYLRKMGVRVDQAPAGTAGFIEIVDTAEFFRIIHREDAPRSLARVMEELGMTGWNLHNAGNDARYTMEVLVRMVLDHSEREEMPV
ncbi:hypothetical protein FE257_008077 [Aspergillus nanangensis]|uniref:Gfd2/YDR514C-like C-terminal domain-containing protein n=1 Tax=Aspergillus nanangensis TaxID=2582783 RepID=A0AAD4CM72_ASPNN|nr:hypothetical protein FE257_008077 [Aspergillus nanangensis]